MILATLDTGALIAMERQKPHGMMLLRAAREHRAQLPAITPVVSEWWRGRSDVRERIAKAVTLVPFPVRSAQAAGSHWASGVAMPAVNRHHGHGLCRDVRRLACLHERRR
jgi:predicted nucleic acid-binding protein